VLEVDGVHTYYGESHVLQGVSLGLAAGEVIALLGRNGMGKTTLIRSIIGFTPPRRGAVRFHGTDITGWPPYRAVERGMGLVPQGRRVFPSLTVGENLEVARRERLDFAIGSKRHPESVVHYPWSRRLASRCYQALNRLLFRLDVRDTQVGLKLFRREVAEDVVPLLLVKRFAFDLELLAGAACHAPVPLQRIAAQVARRGASAARHRRDLLPVARAPYVPAEAKPAAWRIRGATGRTTTRVAGRGSGGGSTARLRAPGGRRVCPCSRR
jgi:ABC-type Fe3+/spermidine/putrescine transport system ATPase subunit